MNRNDGQIDFSPDSTNHYRAGWLIYGTALLMLLFMLGRNALTGGEGDLAWGLQMAKSGRDLFGIDFTGSAPLKWFCRLWALPANLFGTSEWFCRLPSAIAALLMLDGTMRIAKRFFNLRTSCTAGWLLLGSFGFLHWGRHSSMYMMCCAVLIWCAVLLCENEFTFTRYYSFFLLSTFGFCVWGFYFILPWLGIWVLKNKFSFKSGSMKIFSALFSALVTGLWILFLLTISAEGTLRAAFSNLFSGIADVMIHSFCNTIFPGKMWSLYPESLLNLPRMLLPWSLLSAVAITGMLIRFKEQNPQTRKLIITTAVIFLLTGIFPSRRWQFQLCQLPFFILLTAGSIAGECGKSKYNQIIGIITGWIFSIIGALAAGLVITWPLWEILFRISPPLLLMTGVPFAGLLSIAFLVFDTGSQSAVEKKSGMRGSWSGYILAGVCLAAAFYSLSIPAMSAFRSEQKFWSKCGSAGINLPKENIIFYRESPNSAARYYMSLAQGFTETLDDEQFLQHLGVLSPGETILILQKSDLDTLRKLLTGTPWRLASTEPVIAEGEKVRLFSSGKTSEKEFLAFKLTDGQP